MKAINNLNELVVYMITWLEYYMSRVGHESTVYCLVDLLERIVESKSLVTFLSEEIVDKAKKVVQDFCT